LAVLILWCHAGDARCISICIYGARSAPLVPVDPRLNRAGRRPIPARNYGGARINPHLSTRSALPARGADRRERGRSSPPQPKPPTAWRHDLPRFWPCPWRAPRAACGGRRPWTGPKPRKARGFHAVDGAPRRDLAAGDGRRMGARKSGRFVAGGSGAVVRVRRTPPGAQAPRARRRLAADPSSPALLAQGRRGIRLPSPALADPPQGEQPERRRGAAFDPFGVGLGDDPVADRGEGELGAPAEPPGALLHRPFDRGARAAAASPARRRRRWANGNWRAPSPKFGFRMGRRADGARALQDGRFAPVAADPGQSRLLSNADIRAIAIVALCSGNPRRLRGISRSSRAPRE